jgi:Protein kinase domain
MAEPTEEVKKLLQQKQDEWQHEWQHECQQKLDKLQQELSELKVMAAPEEIQKPEILIELQLPLRADREKMKVYYIDDNKNETKIEVVKDIRYLEKLNQDVSDCKLLRETNDGRKIIDEEALKKLIESATTGTCPLGRAVRAAQIANTIQPKFIEFKDRGEMFLQQVVYSPIAELFCAFSESYCADTKVQCAHALYCHEDNIKRNIQYSASCLPDAALRLVEGFYLTAMMELKCDGNGVPYERDFYRCALMTSMSVMAISDYLVKEENQKIEDIDIAIPFIQGNYYQATLYVMRLQGEGSPKIHRITGTSFWDVPNKSEKLDLLAQLAVILARIVQTIVPYQINMEDYFRRKYDSKANQLSNALPNPSSQKSSSRNSGNKSSKKRTLEGETTNTTSPGDNENAAKIAASRLGLIQCLEYIFPRMRELVMFDDDTPHCQRESDFNFYQQESPYFFKGIDKREQSSTNNAVFCKVWREGDRHTSRKNVEEEICFYKRANANDVPSPCVINSLTALDVKCRTHLDKSTTSTYHVLVTQYHQNDVVDENDITVFALSLIRAVQKLHSIGILHCDIKPSNVLWDGTEKRVLLIDFEHAQEEVNAQSYTATRKYEAPEITLGNPHSRKSDAYSVGKTLESEIKKFHSPVAQNILDVVASLLMVSDSERLSLMEAETQLELIGPSYDVVTVTNRNCSSTKRSREEGGSSYIFCNKTIAKDFKKMTA